MYYRNWFMWFWRLYPMVHCLQSWNPQTASVVVPMQTLCLENQGSPWCESQSTSEVPRTSRSIHRRGWCSSSSREHICPSSFFLFISGTPQVGYCPRLLVRAVFTHSTESNTNLFWKHSHRIMFHQRSGHPLPLSRWHIKLAIVAVVQAYMVGYYSFPV